MTEQKPVPTIGEYLRSEREKKNIAIEQVASSTKISLKLLHALESDHFNALPALPFVRGFVMAYARSIGLNPQEVVSRFEGTLTEKMGKKFEHTEANPHIFVERDTSGDNSKTTLSLIMGGFLVAAIAIFAFVKPALKHKHRNHEETSVVTNPTSSGSPATGPSTPTEKDSVATGTPPGASQTPDPTPVDSTKTNPAIKSEANSNPIPDQAKTAEKPKDSTAKPEYPKSELSKKETSTVPKAGPDKQPQQKTPTANETPSQKATATPPPAGSTAIPYSEVKYLLAVRAIEDSWIKYQADDFPLRQYTLKKGQKIFVRGRTSVRFRCYKASGVETSTDGVSFKPLSDNSKTVILPQSAESQLGSNPFKE